MNIICGPIHDPRSLSLSLPHYATLHPSIEKIYLKSNEITKNHSIGVLLSGGIDSAVLLFLILLENINTGNNFKINSYTMKRKDGSFDVVHDVYNFIMTKLSLPKDPLIVVGDNTLSELAQVNSGIIDVLKYNDFVYVGIIDNRPEHSIGWVRPILKESFRIKYPFLNLQKSHVIDILYKYNLDTLLTMTHSCNFPTICGECNGCRERAWGIEQLGR